MAHYLILTHLRESMPEMPLLDAMAVGTRKRCAAAVAGSDAAAADGQPASKRARRGAADPVRLRWVCRFDGYVQWGRGDLLLDLPADAKSQSNNELLLGGRWPCLSIQCWNVLQNAADQAKRLPRRQERAQAQVAALMSEFALAAPPAGGAADEDLGFSSLRSSLDDPDQDADDALLPGAQLSVTDALQEPEIADAHTRILATAGTG